MTTTPTTVYISRLLFGVFFVFSVFIIENNIFLHSTYSYTWFGYLLVIYYIAERLYVFYGQRNIDLAFAFPLLLVIYSFNLASVLLDAQERFPMVNRAEHLLSFVLLTYVVWIFFLKYLPQDTWREHPYYTALIVFSVTSTFGVLNEIVELLLDAIFDTNFIGGRLDTPLDLLMNSLGATLFLSVSLILGGSSPRKHYD